MKKCESCNGEGTIECDECDGGYTECPTCGSNDMTCEECSGDGVITCGECDGSGEVEE